MTLYETMRDLMMQQRQVTFTLGPRESAQLDRLIVALQSRQDNTAVLAALQSLQEGQRKLLMNDQETAALLKKLDDSTNVLAANQQIIADTDQAISDEMDAFIAAVKAAPAGTVLTDAQVTQLQTLADKVQATSNASDSQVAVLQAIASKGVANPVPVTPAPLPPSVLPAPAPAPAPADVPAPVPAPAAPAPDATVPPAAPTA